MIHRSVVVDAVEIPPGGSIRLEPGGLHVMMMGVPSRLEAGERPTLTLVFERAGEVELPAPVGRPPPG